MGEYRDEREAALQRAEALAQENARLQAEVDALRGGRVPRAATPATRRTPRVVGVALGAMVVAGSVAGFMTAVRRAPDAAASSLELRGTWSPPSPIAHARLRASVRAGGGTWVVGDRGTILFRPDHADEWTSVPSGTDADLYAIATRETLVVVGARGTALRFDLAERRWVTEATGSTADLYAITSAGGATLFAVGARGVIIHRGADGLWHAPAPGADRADLYGVALAGDRIVAVGAGGTVVNVPGVGVASRYGAWNGGGWRASEQASPVRTTLRAVASWNGTLLAVGDGGVMITATENSPWTLVRSNTTEDLFAVAATEIPYDERRPSYGGSGSVYGFVAAGAHGTVMVDRLGSTQGWRPVRAGGGAIRAVTSEPWSFFTDDGTLIGFTPR
jgi:hypothetical protein